MDTNLEHEDLLIKLRSLLNEEKVKLWEPPYIANDNTPSDNLKDLAQKYSDSLAMDTNIVLSGLYELQQHSLERSKDNEEFKETGLATFRIKVMVPNDKPKMYRIQKKLSDMGSDLIESVGKEIELPCHRIKLIYNGKVIKATPSLEDQNLKNGVLLMALIMSESAMELKEEKQDPRMKELKSTRDDAALLAENVDDLLEDEYMKLEDQSGKAVELPAAERRSLMVGLALHERGRAAARLHDYSLALYLMLEADRQLSECRSSILSSVDNWAVLQLDIAWCYLCLRSLRSAADAAARLARAEAAFRASYGEDHERLIALKGTAANERVLLMRLHLLQGIVAYHQNKRTQARKLLEKAETELNALRVDEGAVGALLELGWSRAQARAGLRAARGDLDAAHHYLAERRAERDRARRQHRADRERRLLGICEDGSPVSREMLEALRGMGFEPRLATKALRVANNRVAEAVRLIQDQPELLIDDDEDPGPPKKTAKTPSNMLPEGDVDELILAELKGLGCSEQQVRAALQLLRAEPGAPPAALLERARALLPAAAAAGLDPNGPSTSRDIAYEKLQTYLKKKRQRELALQRLSKSINGEEDDHLDTSLTDEEQFLVQYKSLL